MIARDHLQVTEALAALQSKGDHYTRQLLHEKQRVSQYHGQLKAIEIEIARVREENKQKAVELLNKYASTNNSAYQRVDGIDPTRLAEENQKKLMNCLEGRLNKALIRNNTIQSENNVIKEKIDVIRRKKVNDTKKQEELEQSLLQVNEDMHDIMKRASVVTENRDRIVELKSQLEQTNEMERKKFHQEYTKLSTYVDEQNDLLQASISTAASNVVMKLQNAVSVSRNTSQNENENEDNSIDERLEELEQQYASYKSSLQEEGTKYQSYQDALHELQEVSGLSSIEEIVEAFNKHEEELFSLFTYIQTVNQDSDSLLEEKHRLESDLKRIREVAINTEGEQRSSFEKYQNQLDHIYLERNKLTMSVDESKKTIQSISSTVNELFMKLKCKEVEESEEMCPGEDEGEESVCKRSILKRMECLEKRIIQIISLYAQNVAGKPKRRPTVLLSPKMFDRSSLQTANTFDDSNKSIKDDSDDDGDSDTENSLGGRPISVQDMRKQQADKMKNPIVSNITKDNTGLANSFVCDTSIPLQDAESVN